MILFLCAIIVQNTKIYGKQILKYVPLIGWAWYFTESIFLKREWEHDEKIIQKDLQQATDYPEGYYVTVSFGINYCSNQCFYSVVL